MTTEFKVIRSKRKTVALVVKSDGSLEVRAPILYSSRKINEFVTSKHDWISKVKQNMVDVVNFQYPDITESKMLYPKTKARIDEFLSTYQGRKPLDIRIRRQKSVWGTCSTKKTITINVLAGILPKHLFEYVMIHELTHLEVMNHSPYYWNLVSYYIPDWKGRRTELKNYRIRK